MTASRPTTSSHGHKKSGLSALVLKSLSIFGGVQAVGILGGIIRTKLVALWIGPVGVGLFGIFNNAVDLIASTAQIGMGPSTTRQVASTTDPQRQAAISRVARTVCMLLALLAGGITVILAPWLSELSFGSDEYVWAYRLLAVAVFSAPVACAESGILQGMKDYHGVAWAAVLGAIIGLGLSVPALYFWGIDGVVPTLIIYAVGTMLPLVYYGHRFKAKIKVARDQFLSIAGNLLRFGAYFMVSQVVMYIASYAFVIWLNRYADTQTVGYFQAGNTLLSRYIGVFLSAIAVEFYPRLSSVSHSPHRSIMFVNHEAGVLMALMIPICCAFIAFAPLIIQLLYSSEFSCIDVYISIGAIGAMFRSFSYVISYVILSKGDGRHFMMVESLSALVYLVANIGCYLLWGLTGFGVAYIAWFLCYTLMVGYVYMHIYHYTFNNRLIRVLSGGMGAAASCLVAILLLPQHYIGNIIAAAIAVGVACYTLPRINRRKST